MFTNRSLDGDAEGGRPCLQHLPVSACIHTFSMTNSKLLDWSQIVCPWELQKPYPKHSVKTAAAALWIARVEVTHHIKDGYPIWKARLPLPAPWTALTGMSSCLWASPRAPPGRVLPTPFFPPWNPRTSSTLNTLHFLRSNSLHVLSLGIPSGLFPLMPLRWRLWSHHRNSRSLPRVTWGHHVDFGREPQLPGTLPMVRTYHNHLWQNQHKWSLTFTTLKHFFII